MRYHGQGRGRRRNSSGENVEAVELDHLAPNNPIECEFSTDDNVPGLSRYRFCIQSKSTVIANKALKFIPLLEIYHAKLGL